MTILFEEFPYDTAYLAQLLPEHYYWRVSPTQSKVPFVGYCHAKKEAVIILPKVFLRSGHFLGDHHPDDLRQLANHPNLRDKLKSEKRLDFLFTISTWLYLAIRQYQQRHPANEVTEAVELATVVGKADKQATTELDWVLSLIRFYRDNQSLLTFIKKQSSSQRGKTNWGRTVARQLPLISTKGQPVYGKPDSKQRVVNVDEELIVLFLVVLEDLKTRYFLRLDLPDIYPLPSKSERTALLRNGSRRLQQIRYKYFTDRLVRLWELLWGYFAYSEQAANGPQQPEVALIRNFNSVFEDMIDQLLSDSDAIKRFKKQKDGKELDHIYDYQSLIATDHIYYIGDSKYYKDSTPLGQETVQKQYTYARNIIQYNVDLLNRNKLGDPLRYRDELTEGYNPTPNFFISAVVNDQLAWTNPSLEFIRSIEPPNYHFANRLFDRDTLTVQAYTIDFLFVLSAYVSGNRSEQDRFKQQTQQLFREKLVQHLNSRYVFWRVTPRNASLDSFVSQYFRVLNGKMYRPSTFEDALLVAFLIDDVPTEWASIEQEATVTKWPLY